MQRTPHEGPVRAGVSEAGPPDTEHQERAERRRRDREGQPDDGGQAEVFGRQAEQVRDRDGQQGRLYIGFAAAELLGLMAFAVAMLILFAF